MFRTIETTFWISRSVADLAPEGKLLAIYLITNPHTHVSGFYYLPREIMAIETGLKIAALDRVCNTLSETGFASFDMALKLVWVVNMFHYQGRGEKNLISASMQLKGFRHSLLCRRFAEKYPDVLKVEHGYRIPDDQIGYPAQGSQDQEKDQDKDQNSFAQKKGARKKTNIPDGFELFWTAYPNRDGIKRGKKATIEKWLSVAPEDRGSLLQAAKNYAMSREAKDGFAKDPERFFKKDFWLDFVDKTTGQVSNGDAPANGDGRARAITKDDPEWHSYRG